MPEKASREWSVESHMSSARVIGCFLCKIVIDCGGVRMVSVCKGFVIVGGVSGIIVVVIIGF